MDLQAGAKTMRTKARTKAEARANSSPYMLTLHICLNYDEIRLNAHAHKMVQGRAQNS